MKLVFKLHYSFSPKELKIIEELSFHTTILYNIANNICREQGYKPYVDMEKELSLNWHNEFLHSHNYQQCLKVLDQDWKSFFQWFNLIKKHFLPN